MKVVIFSDTHFNPVPISLPECDLALFCGDCSFPGKRQEFESFIDWFEQQPAGQKAMTPGNHDWYCAREPVKAKEYAAAKGVNFLIDEGADLCGLKIWGTPYQPLFCNWAFNVTDYHALDNHYDLIPNGLDFLITHCPPHGVLDMTPINSFHSRPEHVGSGRLSLAIKRAEPRFNVFGHIHNGYGTRLMSTTTFINASICTEEYEPTNKVIIVYV